MEHGRHIKSAFELLILGAFFLLATAVSGVAQDSKRKIETQNNDVTLLVTAMPHNDRTRAIADRLQASDFSVLEDKRVQKIVSVKKSDAEPVIFALLIQDDLVLRVNNEFDEIRDFIRGLPEGSRVMVGYITSGSLRVRQAFTADKNAAAESLRILTSSDLATPFSPYLHAVDGLKLFDNQPQGRRMMLMISDGLDNSNGFRRGSPYYSVYLDQAVSEAQRRGVAVYTIYAPSTGWTGTSRLAANYGQGSLFRLSDETGGEAFFSGMDFVTFNPYFKEYNELLNNQWIITYTSNNVGKGFRRVEVTTDFDIPLNHTNGYQVR